METIYLPVGGDTSVPHIHYYTVFGLLQSFVLFSVSFGRRAGACVRATHMWICQLLTVATFVGIGGRGRTIEWTMRLVYRFASDCDRIVAPDE